jgi:phage shock protein C
MQCAGTVACQLHWQLLGKITESKMTKLKLNKVDKKFMGVCAGLADWSEIDASIIRIVFVITALIGVGSPVLIYLLLGFILD